MGNISVTFGDDTRTEREDLPTGVPLVATIVSIEEKTINYTDRQTGEAKSFKKLSWKFSLIDHDDRWVWGDCDAFFSNHPKNKLQPWIEAVRRKKLDRGESVELGDLVGLRVQVELNPREYNGNTYYDVVNLVSYDPADSDEPPF
jgi:hypothetical protein